MNVKRFIVGELQTNCYIVSTQERDAFIIDPGDDAQAIRRFINDNKLNVHFIINTHTHIDHIKADKELRFPVYVHALEAEALEKTNRNFSSFLLGGFQPCTPARLLQHGDVISCGDLSLEIIHTPGHSEGGICIKVGDVIFTGDTLFKDGIGRTDLPGGSLAALSTSIRKKLFCFTDSVIIYPGHGPASTIGQERTAIEG